MTANNYENPVSIQVRDFMAEREEQRIGVDERRIERRHAYLFDKLEQLKQEHPELDAAALERLTVGDCMFDLENRLGMIRLYADSIANLCNEHVEDIGRDVPAAVELLQVSLWHLQDDIARFQQDADGVRKVASALIERRPAI